MGFNLKCTLDNTINVGGYKIEIVETKHFFRDTGKYGEWIPNSLKIVVDADLPETLKEETKLHELLHAIMSLYDIRIKHHKLEVLSVVLYQILTETRK